MNVDFYDLDPKDPDMSGHDQKTAVKPYFCNLYEVTLLPHDGGY
jgi:hypothetical protein